MWQWGWGGGGRTGWWGRAEPLELQRGEGGDPALHTVGTLSVLALTLRAPPGLSFPWPPSDLGTWQRPLGLGFLRRGMDSRPWGGRDKQLWKWVPGIPRGICSPPCWPVITEITGSACQRLGKARWRAERGGEKVLEGHTITEKGGRCWQRQPRPLSCPPDLSVQSLNDPGAPRPIWPTRRPPLKAHSLLHNKHSPAPRLPSLEPGGAPWGSLPCTASVLSSPDSLPGVWGWPGSCPPPPEVRRPGAMPG